MTRQIPQALAKEAATKLVKISFNVPYPFESRNVKKLTGIIGLYLIFLEKVEIQYPFGRSRLIYIGKSEKRTNSIGSRLLSHYDGQSGNVGLVNYRKVEKLYFTYLNFEMLKGTWKHGIEALETFFIMDFVRKYGVYPICNNKTGVEVATNQGETVLDIDWEYFERRP